MQLKGAITASHQVIGRHAHIHRHSLAAKEEEVQPQPGEDQHDDGDGEAEDEPRAEVYHLCVWITTGKKEAEREV